jgi:hypothetical protein
VCSLTKPLMSVYRYAFKEFAHTRKLAGTERNPLNGLWSVCAMHLSPFLFLDAIFLCAHSELYTPLLAGDLACVGSRQVLEKNNKIAV